MSGQASGIVVKRQDALDRKSTRLNSSHRCISYAVFCLKKKINSEHSGNCLTGYVDKIPAAWVGNSKQSESGCTRLILRQPSSSMRSWALASIAYVRHTP